MPLPLATIGLIASLVIVILYNTIDFKSSRDRG
jgi:hypothetical protein